MDTNDPKGQKFPGDVIDGSSFLLNSRRYCKTIPQVEAHDSPRPGSSLILCFVHNTSQKSRLRESLETRTHSRFKTETRGLISSYLTFHFALERYYLEKRNRRSVAISFTEYRCPEQPDGDQCGLKGTYHPLTLTKKSMKYVTNGQSMSCR
ncbi:hypothetical protein F8388_000461 [Cannabis sativa]|uniref:Uncharacterized protein n=1 Tax=Cannabis sativa TaxID=3483 RepID=A0A7J6EZL5_CANSA|nr:hypothetical protein F8388_000461 [Cannabis sativa]KAF4394045.1 hypothetical protein G4B88_026014 [Cannabis sativa]